MRYQSICVASKKSVHKDCIQIWFGLKALVETALKHKKWAVSLQKKIRQQNTALKPNKQPKQMLSFSFWKHYPLNSFLLQNVTWEDSDSSVYTSQECANATFILSN